MKQFLLLMSCVFMVTTLWGQRTITGTVTNDQGEPLIGASVYVEGNPSTGTITDFEGEYELRVSAEASTLVFSYTGYETIELEIGASNEINATLSEGLTLDEAVVVAYGEQTRRELVSNISTLDENKVNRIPAISPQQILQGQVSGVQMTNSSGVLGSDVSIRIRGVASLTAGGQPLFIIDGVPMNDQTQDYSNTYGGSTGLNPLLNLSQDDIASISVLKDASAAAMYGSRGSNGVVLITTKKGTRGQDNISFNLEYGAGEATNLFDMTNSSEYYSILNRYRGTTIPDEIPYFDWQDAVTQQAQTFKTGLSFDGGDDKTRYYVGGSYLNDKNYVIGNDLRKLAAKVNLSHKLSDKLTIGANLGVSDVLTDRISVENSTFAPLTSAYLQYPDVLAYNEDGSFARTGFIANVLAIEEEGIVDFRSRRTYGNTYLEYLIDNIGAGQIELRTDFGIDQLQTEETFRETEIITPGGYGYHRIVQADKWLTTNTARYSLPFGNNSNFSILAGQSYETSRTTSTAVEGTGFAADALRNVSSASQPSLTANNRTEWALASFFGRGQVDLQGKYFIEANVRRDGSSRFGRNNRWGTFWSVGAGWSVVQEDFMAGQNIFDDLKLRASFGKTGNDRIGNFQSLGLYEAGVASDYGGNAGLRPIQPQNSDLKWEETVQFDVGVDMRVWNTVGLGVSYYHKNTSDLILGVPLAYAGGISDIVRNVGSMVNDGVDIDLSVDVFRNRDWNINLAGNISFLNNEITSLPDDASIDSDGNKFITGSASQRAVLGRTANEFFLIRYNGINPQTGDAEWLDKDGNPTTSPLSSDRVFVGSALPDFTGGFSLNINYKGLSLNSFFNYTSGNEVMLDGLRFTENPVSFFNKSTVLLDYWQEPGDEAFAPGEESATASSFAQRSTLQLMNGSYLRLKNLTLSYDLSKHINGLKKFQVFVRGTNLLTFQDPDFRGQDPEVSDAGTNNQVVGESFFVIPQRKMYTAGVSVKF